MNVCIIGTGHVGLVTGACLASVGHNIWCIDSDKEKINALVAGKVPIYEPGLDSLVAEGQRKKLLNFTTSIAEGVRKAEVVFICVGTPPKATGEANLEFSLVDKQKLKELLRYPIMIDGRNMFDRKEMEKLGFTYYGVGA